MYIFEEFRCTVDYLETNGVCSIRVYYNAFTNFILKLCVITKSIVVYLFCFSTITQHWRIMQGTHLSCKDGWHN